MILFKFYTQVSLYLLKKSCLYSHLWFSQTGRGWHRFGEPQISIPVWTCVNSHSRISFSVFFLFLFTVQNSRPTWQRAVTTIYSMQRKNPFAVLSHYFSDWLAGLLSRGPVQLNTTETSRLCSAATKESSQWAEQRALLVSAPCTLLTVRLIFVHTWSISSIVAHRLCSCSIRWLISCWFHYWCSVCMPQRNLTE